jgi:hypothetical protein
MAISWHFVAQIKKKKERKEKKKGKEEGNKDDKFHYNFIVCSWIKCKCEQSVLKAHCFVCLFICFGLFS